MLNEALSFLAMVHIKEDLGDDGLGKAVFKLREGAWRTCPLCFSGTRIVVPDSTFISFVFLPVTKGTGDCCGGSFVDEAFRSALAAKLPQGVFDSFASRHPGPLLRLLGAWESKKRAFDGNGGIFLATPPELVCRSFRRYQPLASHRNRVVCSYPQITLLVEAAAAAYVETAAAADDGACSPFLPELSLSSPLSIH